MSARFELVRTDAGTHARYVARNGKTVWSTEVYSRRQRALDAIRILAEAFSADGRVWIGAGHPPMVVIPLDNQHLGLKLGIPVVDVDERNDDARR